MGVMGPLGALFAFFSPFVFIHISQYEVDSTREREVDTLDIRRRHRERAISAAAVLHSVVRARCSAFLCTVVSARTTRRTTERANEIEGAA